MIGYVKDFVGSEPVKQELRNIILYIGQKCENENVQSVRDKSIMAHITDLNLLLGSKILEQPTGRTYKLTEKRGKEIYELLKKEESKESCSTFSDSGPQGEGTGG